MLRARLSRAGRGFRVDGRVYPIVRSAHSEVDGRYQPMQRPSLLFVTRKFPPSTGGMETLSHDIAIGLSESRDMRVIALGHSQVHLIWFVPVAVIKVLLACYRSRPLQVLYGDAMIYTLMRPFVSQRFASSYVVACGLDVTWSNRVYQRLVRVALRRATAVLPISRATATEVEKRGIPSQRIRIINLGIAPLRYEAAALERMRSSTRMDHGVHDSDLLVVSVGRLVERKGIVWFLESVVPDLDGNVVVIIAGDGPLRGEIEQAVSRASIDHRIEILGRVPDVDRDRLLAAADVFVMPNLRVEGDMEGFGLAAAEAAMFDTLVVASRLEGLIDAVDEDETGVFCETEDEDCFISTINLAAGDLGGTRSMGARFGRNARRLKSRKAMTESIMEQLDTV